MAVTLRLARRGQKKRPFYKIVAAEKQSWRDGRFLEVVGYYNPMVNPALISLKDEAVKRWLSVGAQTSDVVATMIKKQMPGVLEEILNRRTSKVQAARKARKQRAAARLAKAQ